MALMVMLLWACEKGETVDLKIRGGDIHLDGVSTTDVLALSQGRVVAVGEEALSLDATREIDLTGGSLWPGATDAHTHTLAGSFALDRLLLMGVNSIEDLVDEVEAYLPEAEDEPWIVGYGWQRQSVPDVVGGELDAIATDKPMLLVDNSGHTALVNAIALEVAGIDANTLDPEGGEVVRDPITGEPTGLLLEAALGLVSEAALSDYDNARLSTGLVGALDDFSRTGLTTLAEILAVPGFDLSRPEIYRQLEQDGALPVRIAYYAPIFGEEDIEKAVALRTEDTDQVWLAGGKLWIDGSMGNGEAWVSEPHENDPEAMGTAYFSEADLRGIVRAAEAHNLPLKMHVNGDAALEAVLDVLEEVDAEVGGSTLRHVLDHLVLVDPLDRARMALLGIVGSVQPAHFLPSSLGDAPDNWGSERFGRAYDPQALLESSVELAMGTDWPVWLSVDPLLNVWAAVQLPDGRGLTVEQALHAYQAGGAYAVGREDELGCLRPGCLADMVVYEEDPRDVELVELPDVGVQSVWLGGRQVY